MQQFTNNLNDHMLKKKGALSNGTVRNKSISKYQNTIDYNNHNPLKPSTDMPGYIQNY